VDNEAIVKSNFLSNFKLDGVIPRVVLSSNVTSEQVSCFTTEFGRYIKGAKVFEDLILPRNLVLSYLGKFSEIDFYASSLRPFIENKYIKDDKSAEDQVINLIFAYFARRIQRYKRISNLRKFNWIKDETFEVFAGRAISIIKTANIRSFSETQLQIMGLVDMISNQVLKKKCQGKLDALLKLTLTEAFEKVRE